MSARLSLDEVLALILDDDFGLSEDESSGEEGEGITSYLEKSSVYTEVVLPLGREVVLDLPSSDQSGCTQGEYLDGGIFI